MASFESVRTLTGIAGEALTIYRFVTRQADGDFNLSAITDWPHGICAESVADQVAFPYVVADGGTAKVEAGAVLALNDEISVGASGVAIAAAGTAPTVGRVMSAATAIGDIIEMQFIGKPEDTTA